jgi:hypothetical protein
MKPYQRLQYWIQQLYVVSVSITVLGATQKWGIALAILIPLSIWLWEYNSKPNAPCDFERELKDTNELLQNVIRERNKLGREITRLRVRAESSEHESAMLRGELQSIACSDGGAKWLRDLASRALSNSQMRNHQP